KKSIRHERVQLLLHRTYPLIVGAVLEVWCGLYQYIRLLLVVFHQGNYVLLGFHQLFGLVWLRDGIAGFLYSGRRALRPWHLKRECGFRWLFCLPRIRWRRRFLEKIIVSASP